MVILVVVLYCGYGGLCFLAQRRLIYPGGGIRVPADIHPPAGVIPIALESGFGRNEAWLLPASGVTTTKRPLVLFFHGNGEVIDFLPEQVQEFRRWGMNVLLVEYPGYGRSGGKPSEAGITATAVAAYDAMIKRDDVDSAKIIGFGRSLGCGAACNLSRQRPLAALILQSPFTSTRPFARRFLLPGFLLLDVYDNRSALAEFAGPVLIMHGRYDDIIPFSQGQELARVARDATFVEFACGHNDLPPDWREFWSTVGEFLNRHNIATKGR
jgi:fermentation-respiration switch protein FrsA (DUF1100 family)